MLLLEGAQNLQEAIRLTDVEAQIADTTRRLRVM